MNSFSFYLFHFLSLFFPFHFHIHLISFLSLFISFVRCISPSHSFHFPVSFHFLCNVLFLSLSFPLFFSPLIFLFLLYHFLPASVPFTLFLAFPFLFPFHSFNFPFLLPFHFPILWIPFYFISFFHLFPYYLLLSLSLLLYFVFPPLSFVLFSCSFPINFLCLSYHFLFIFAPFHFSFLSFSFSNSFSFLAISPLFSFNFPILLWFCCWSCSSDMNIYKGSGENTRSFFRL